MTPEEQEATFQRWLQDHSGLVWKVVRGFAVLPHDQEDFFQDVLAKLWSTLQNFRGEAKETTWIYRVSINTAIIWQRSERRRQKKHEMFQQQCCNATGSSHNDGSSINERIERLYDAIRKLSKVDMSLALMHLDGLSYREMSEILGISENSIGVRLTRIRKQLSEDLGDLEDGS